MASTGFTEHARARVAHHLSVGLITSLADLQQVRVFRPLACLLANIFLPLAVLVLTRKPCFLARLSRLVLAVVGRGPQRIWPSAAGLPVIDVFGTRSKAASPAVVGIVGCMMDAERRDEDGERKTGLARGQVVGLRVGSEEKDLVEAVSWRFWVSGSRVKCGWRQTFAARDSSQKSLVS
ncbi:hypothetical protein M0657_003260 [Pyricularia oryzae]|nr:hypothetical protein M9X92_005381 [Pyricularia oryzae]KAI7927438.1 hypothetical protein M0657_003260 [Pyricularia oryzae]